MMGSNTSRSSLRIPSKNSFAEILDCNRAFEELTPTASPQRYIATERRFVEDQHHSAGARWEAVASNIQ